MSVCGYVHMSDNACGSQKRELDHMELELQAIADCEHPSMGAGNQMSVLRE